MQEADSSQPATQRRRSERVSKALPVLVRGIDLLGQPFDERTATLAFNLHGCRYTSKHHLPKNSWVTIEVVHGLERRNARARVAWIQRPHSVREFFQIGVELESPANIWGLNSPPEDWALMTASAHAPARSSVHREARTAAASEADPIAGTFSTFMERVSAEMTNPSREFGPASGFPAGTESVPPGETPLLHVLNGELERQAKQAVEAAAAQATEQIRRTTEEFDRKRSAKAEEFFERWKEEFERAQSGAQDSFTSQLAARQDEFFAGLKSELKKNLGHAREVMNELDRKAQALRAESEAAIEATSRVAQARLQMEAAEAVRAAQQPAEISEEALSAAESAAAGWRQRLESEMAVAQAQWNELLQSSLDSSMQRLAGQLSERSQDALRAAEQKISERFAELRQPLAQTSTEAREALTGVKSALEQEVARARSSLAEIEHAASQMKEYSAQLEAASHDTLNELHRRLEAILEAQTDEMNRRVESLVAAAPQRLTPSLDSLGHQLVERTIAEAESKLSPHLERVPELLRELASREVQVEEGLRLHRERLRQVSENNQREVASQMAGTLTGLRNDFEAARKEALTKWNEELEAGGVHASHAAAESIGRTSEWVQQEARARLQVQVEQTLAAAASNFEEKTAEAEQKFAAELDGESSAHLAQIRQQLDGVAGELTGRTRTQLGEAAEAAAASFGQVLRGISEQEVQQFTNTTRGALQERRQELERLTEQLLRNIETGAGSSVERFQAQMVSEVEASVAQGRSALTAEFAATFEGYRAERDARQKEWTQSLDRLSDEAAGKYQERVETTCDSWVVSSVRRLNEHGQNVIESLMRSADQTLRDSCAKFFEGLAEVVRDRTTSAAGAGSFAPGSNREAAEAPLPRNDSASDQPTA